MDIQILEHEKIKIGLLVHRAKVEVTDFQGDKEELVEKVSIKLGYHPLGHGIYGTDFVEKLDENTYALQWKTGTHCD